MRLFSDVSQQVSDPWLRRAFMLAEKGRGTTSPNPLVGCVLVKQPSPDATAEVVGEGFHEHAGGPHAEIVALEAAGDAALGATAYITLEPCAHHGRTPPCTDALREAGVAKAVIGMRDPNADVRGGGAEILQASWIEIVFAEDPTPFVIQNEAWLASLRTRRPFLRVKLALSIDGHPALAAGQRASITGPSGAEVTRTLRRRADAVLVGGSTVAIDDPQLTARDAGGEPASRQPARVVFVRETLPPRDARVLTDGATRTLLLAPAALAEQARGTLPSAVEIVAYSDTSGVAGAMRALFEVGFVDVLVEAGPRLFTALWDDHLTDELVCVHAGGVAGASAPDTYVGEPAADPDASNGSETPHAATAPSPAGLPHVMAPVECGIVGDVAVSVWRPNTASSPSEATRR